MDTKRNSDLSNNYDSNMTMFKREVTNDEFEVDQDLVQSIANSIDEDFERELRKENIDFYELPEFDDVTAELEKLQAMFS